MIHRLWIRFLLVLLMLPSLALGELVAGKGGVVELQFGPGFSGEVGEQRKAVFRRAAKVWADKLVITETVVVSASFVALTCSDSGAVLGSAGPSSYQMDFDGAPKGLTWYPIALANQLAGRDLNPGAADIRAQFNASIDDGCFNGQRWNYSESGDGFALYQTVMHELAHGFGFTTVLNLSDGFVAAGGSDHYITHIADRSGRSLADMTPPERTDAVVSDALFWHGKVAQARSKSVSGASTVAMHAPAQLRSGSSISHFSAAKVNAVAPEETMQPYYMSGAMPWLADAALADMGWGVVWQNELVELRPSRSSVEPGQAMAVQLTINRATALQEGVSALRVSQSVGALSSNGFCESESARVLYCDLYQIGEADVVSIPLSVVHAAAGEVAMSVELLLANEEARSSGAGEVVDQLSLALNFVNPEVESKEEAVGAVPPWLFFVLLCVVTFTRNSRVVLRN